MSNISIIQETIELISKLPDNKLIEVRDFADFLLKQYEDRAIIENIKDLVSKSMTFDFLNEDDDLYTVNDIKEKYYAKR